MFKLKPIYEYLGDADFDLNARIDARCPTCSPANNPVAEHRLTEGVSTVMTAASRRFPEVAKINDTMFMMLYVNGNIPVNGLYYKVVTVASDGSLTLGAEGTLFSGPTPYYYHIVYLSDNKILLAYTYTPTTTDVRVSVVNFSGAVPTFGAEVVVNSIAQARGYYSELRLGLLSAGKVLMTFICTDNLKIAAQVIEISALDVITYGLTYTDVTANRARPRLAILDSSRAIVGCATDAVNVVGKLISMGISGTVVTWGTALDISNITQLPGSSSRQLFFADICADSSGDVQAIGGHVTDATYGHIVMPVTYGVPTTATPAALKDASSDSSPQSTRAALLHRANHTVGAVETLTAGLRGLALNVYSTGTPPTRIDQVVVEPPTVTHSFTNPEMVYLGNRRSSLVYHTTNGDYIVGYTFLST
jgi:hypothetical protein